MTVVESDGHQAVSLRDLAQTMEVSRSAPYRHFVDRDALLRAVAAHGFRQLQAAHDAAMSTKPDVRERVREAGRVFLQFTKAHPRLFILMFDAGVLTPVSDADELGMELHATYDAVGNTVRQALPTAADDQVKLAMITLWSTLYGFARLRMDSSLRPYMSGNLSQLQIEEAVIEAAFLPLMHNV